MGNLLIGKKVVDVKIADDEQAMLFVTDDGQHLVVQVDADCCSYTWIESVEMPALGLPFNVISCEDLDMPDLGDIPGCDFVQYYGAKIITDKGEMIIDYRNDSNGYYGGNIVWPGDDCFYGGVYGQNNSSMDWVDVE